jgi:hypothetical protein
VRKLQEEFANKYFNPPEGLFPDCLYIKGYSSKHRHFAHFNINIFEKEMERLKKEKGENGKLYYVWGYGCLAVYYRYHDKSMIRKYLKKAKEYFAKAAQLNSKLGKDCQDEIKLCDRLLDK